MTNIHEYVVTNDGHCCHIDFYSDYVDESNDFTWSNTTYKVDVTLLPSHYNEVDDDTEQDILQYHYGNIPKPIWIIQDA